MTDDNGYSAPIMTMMMIVNGYGAPIMTMMIMAIVLFIFTQQSLYTQREDTLINKHVLQRQPH